MPDLIIKPTNTSGNKVIIQDQAGGAVLTTADSGATLSNVTVTSGNLSNSALVYPAGHVVQTTDLTSATTETTISSTNNQWSDTVVQGSITPLYSNSDIAIYANFQCLSHDTAGDMGFGFRIKKTISSTVSYPDDISGWEGAGNIHSAFYRETSPPYLVNTFTYAWLDTSGNTAGTASTYQLQGAQYNVGGINGLAIGGVFNSRWHIWFQEIKR
jgi:hypothetical protein